MPEFDWGFECKVEGLTVDAATALWDAIMTAVKDATDDDEERYGAVFFPLSDEDNEDIEEAEVVTDEG